MWFIELQDAGNFSSASNEAGDILLGIAHDPEASHLGALHAGGINPIRSPKHRVSLAVRGADAFHLGYRDGDYFRPA